MKKIFEHKNYSLIMLLSILLYSLFEISSVEIAKKMQLIFIIGSLPILFYHKDRIFKDPMFQLLGLALLLQIASWLNATIYLPDIASEVPKLDRLAKLFSFIFIAYWLQGNLRNVYLLWGTLAVGFIIGCFVNVDFFNEISKALNGTRIDFEIKNAQFTSMFSGISLLISGFILPQVLSNKKPFQAITTSHKVLLSILIIIASLFFAFISIVTQSRQVWLALALAFFMLPIFYALIFPKSNRKLIFISYLLIGVIFTGLSQLEMIQKRVLLDTGTLQTIISGDLDNIPMTSIGIRVNSWILATDWIKERPILGSGAEAISEVIQQSDKFTGELKKIGHLHNYHIETIVAYGSLGLLLIYTLYYWLVRSLFITRIQQPELSALAVFSLMFVTFWACINLFETINARSFGVYTHNIMFAGFYTFYLTSSLKKQDNLHENCCCC
ncbi:MAG: O-antigen ligase family protein [Psychromonas sp.]|nr:O-antigen ligase family protein [Alteromonadales bacterium]MCP5078747.1 O-antigen ligase family protein [Psychromonas sp.]